MTYAIEEHQELFVLEERFGGMDTVRTKFKIQLPLIKQAVEYGTMSEKKRDELDDEINEFLDAFDDSSISNLLANIISNYFDPNIQPFQYLNDLTTTGLFGVECEEHLYGVGLTKEKAYQAFCELNCKTNDTGWD